MLSTRVAISKQQATLCWSRNWIRQQYLNNLKERFLEGWALVYWIRTLLPCSLVPRDAKFVSSLKKPLNDEQKTPVVTPQLSSIRDDSRQFCLPIKECKTEPSSLKSFFIRNDDTRDGDGDWNVSWWSLVISVTAFCSLRVMNSSRTKRCNISFTSEILFFARTDLADEKWFTASECTVARVVITHQM